ncbi:Electron transport complex subunit RsxB [Tepidimonas thermarum]|uniref:Electron transport complex subunit RsxB n=2 Tax=Tepidimonas thermarum TaxID=335431 RepID=A0A554X3F3_9BURK|nr:4Fe-4S binding protein [Tepidimonas thermarum]TSE30335.1 Electron transport complex subunit RsxB [Tepidimonas thermarum]
MTTLICNCNRTMPLDGVALGRVLGETLAVHTTLCRREAAAFQRAARDAGDLVVACTQEQRLFTELAEATEGVPPLAERPIRFVNIRETGGWSREAAHATPKMAALLAAARLPDPDPVPSVRYDSAGRLLIIGPLDQAEALADRLADVWAVSILATGGAGRQARRYPVLAGRIVGLTGWLGAFALRWRDDNPIALDLCTRCNACVAACPEGAIGLDYQVNLGACRGHRDCVRVCEAPGAIDFARSAEEQQATFDAVLDLRPAPAFTQHALPQGYVHLPPTLEAEQRLARLWPLRDLVGTFEKPKFFQYQQRLCAHGRNEQVGCQACIEVCSASAVRSDIERNRIVVEPHLCVGCGACTTVCPTGALTYAYPTAAHQGRAIKTLLSTYRAAGGRDAVWLLHSQGAGQRVIEDWGRAARLDADIQGVPARVIPWPLWHTASTGLELWLSAIAYGASQVWVLMTDEEAPAYRDALQQQMAVAEAILQGLGYRGEHFRLLPLRDARDLAALDAAARGAPAQGVATPATFGVQADKRATLELALEHLMAHAPAPQGAEIALPAVGSPLGTVRLDTEACTLCMSCVGACPAGALQDNPQAPQLRFIEKNCVQCGLCVKTCPEDALQLQPRLWLEPQRRQPRVLHEQPPFQCIRCGKPFGTLKGVETMLARLSGHPMFQGAAAERLKMCGDCRVIDIHTSREVKITDL